MVFKDKGDVSVNRAPWQQGKVLKDVGQRIQAAGWWCADLKHLALRWLFQPAEQAQQRGLAATRGTDNADDLARRHVQRDVPQNLGGAVVVMDVVGVEVQGQILGGKGSPLPGGGLEPKFNALRVRQADQRFDGTWSQSPLMGKRGGCPACRRAGP